MRYKYDFLGRYIYLSFESLNDCNCRHEPLRDCGRHRLEDSALVARTRPAESDRSREGQGQEWTEREECLVRGQRLHLLPAVGQSLRHSASQCGCFCCKGCQFQQRHSKWYILFFIYLSLEKMIVLSFFLAVCYLESYDLSKPSLCMNSEFLTDDNFHRGRKEEHLAMSIVCNKITFLFLNVNTSRSSTPFAFPSQCPGASEQEQKDKHLRPATLPATVEQTALLWVSCRHVDCRVRLPFRLRHQHPQTLLQTCTDCLASGKLYLGFLMFHAISFRK